jgi:hypothetical protein
VDGLDDAKYLAEMEHYGTVDQIREDVRKFLSQFNEYQSLLP